MGDIYLSIYQSEGWLVLVFGMLSCNNNYGVCEDKLWHVECIQMEFVISTVIALYACQPSTSCYFSTFIVVTITISSSSSVSPPSSYFIGVM